MAPPSSSKMKWKTQEISTRPNPGSNFWGEQPLSSRRAASPGVGESVVIASRSSRINKKTHPRNRWQYVSCEPNVAVQQLDSAVDGVALQRHNPSPSSPFSNLMVLLVKWPGSGAASSCNNFMVPSMALHCSVVVQQHDLAS